MLKIKILALGLIVAALAVYPVHHHFWPPKVATESVQQAVSTVKADSSKLAATSQCVGKIKRTLVVSVSSQHFWACANDVSVYDSAVITGKLKYDDSTPVGTYKIFSKLTNQDLKGCQPDGCWNDEVAYWLPYQQADGGTIGFHDASWRSNSNFGNIKPSSNKGSHGCVELPNAAAKWLYSWASVGTTVIIKA